MADDTAPKARGKALPRSDEDLDRLSRIDEPVIAAAQVWWVKAAPRPYRRLLDAREVEDEEGGDGGRG